MWCEPAENIIGTDTDGDGLVYNRNIEGQNSGIESTKEETNDEQ